jgi:hypothetical protein
MLNHLPTLVLALAAPNRGSADSSSWTVPIRIEEAGGYAANPSTLSLPLRQDLTEARIQRLSSGRHSIALVGGPQPLELSEVDLGLLVPRVPAYVRGNDDLARFTLFQREFNRNEVKFGAAGTVADFKLANNCLRTGLWEVLLDVAGEKGNALNFHGWFTFPAEEYARLFELGTGRSLEACNRLVAEYPSIDGMAAPLDALREVTAERRARVQVYADEVPVRFGEQKRKAKLILTTGLERYADFVAADEQPFRVARFEEPGFYDPTKPVEFDLRWLAQPAGATVREVRVGTTAATEVEIAFAGGRRIVLGDRDLAHLPARDAAPDDDKHTLRLTFGIGTPDIYATRAEREAEVAAERPNWLMLLGPDGRHVDNHQAGVDRVFCWNEAGKLLHVYLVGYERTAVVAHLAVPLSAE